MKTRILFILGIIAAILGAANTLVAKLASAAPVPMWVGILVGGLGAAVASIAMFIQMGGPPTIPPLTPGTGVALFLFAFLAGQLSGCKTVGGVDGGVTTPPVITGVVDCATSAFTGTVTIATLVPIVEHAIEQKDPIAALNQLLNDYTEAELDCVVAYLGDLGSRETIASPTDSMAKLRVSVTSTWLKRPGAKVTPTNFAGTAK